MTERRPDPPLPVSSAEAPLTESALAASAPKRLTMRELRELRRSERAPGALHRRISLRLERELTAAARPSDEAPARTARRSWKPEQRWLALGFLAACLPLALALLQLHHGTGASGARSRQVALAPEPAGAGRAGSTGVPSTAPTGERASGAGATPGVEQAAGPLAPSAAASDKPALPGGLVSSGPVSRRDSANLAAAFAKKRAAAAPGSTLGEPSPETQPGLFRELSARSVVIPGFAPTSRAFVSDGPLPRAVGPNLITNGDFSHGSALWSVRRWESAVRGDSTEQADPTLTARAPYEIVKGALCTTIPAGEFAVGGWPWEDRSLSPSSFELERGQRYRLSLRAWSKGSLSVALVVKVGQQLEPYIPALVATVPVTRVSHRFSVAFEPHEGDDEAGLAFIASTVPGPGPPLGSSELCIDDVQLTREAHAL